MICLYVMHAFYMDKKFGRELPDYKRVETFFLFDVFVIVVGVKERFQQAMGDF